MKNTQHTIKRPKIPGGLKVKNAPKIKPGSYQIFIDESGSNRDGIAVYSAVVIPMSQRQQADQNLLAVRSLLNSKYSIPASQEIHATKFVGGRGRPSTNPSFNTKESRLEAMELYLHRIGHMSDLTILTVYCHMDESVRDYRKTCTELYERLISYINVICQISNSFCEITIDGNGTDPSYKKAHRRIDPDNRRVVGDPTFMPADKSLWLQVADSCAWSAYQHLARQDGKQRLWTWYEVMISPVDLHNGVFLL